jgi:hypothetical protein
MKTYGLILADNGSDMYITGTMDARWDNDVLNPAFAAVRASDFEVVLLGYNPCGDLDADGSTNAADAGILAQYLAGNISQGGAPFSAPAGGADLDGDGAATVTDLTALRHFLAGHIPFLPLE